MASYYGTIPMGVRIDLDGDFTDELETKVENDEELFEVFASNILCLTEDELASYEVEYEGDGSFSFSADVKMIFDAWSTPGYWDDNGGCPPDGGCEMDESRFDDRKIASAIASELPEYLKGRNVKVYTSFDDSGIDLNYEPISPW